LNTPWACPWPYTRLMSWMKTHHELQHLLINKSVHTAKYNVLHIQQSASQALKTNVHIKMFVCGKSIHTHWGNWQLWPQVTHTCTWKKNCRSRRISGVPSLGIRANCGLVWTREPTSRTVNIVLKIWTVVGYTVFSQFCRGHDLVQLVTLLALLFDRLGLMWISHGGLYSFKVFKVR
jgi:hypothetical protein